MWTDPGVNQMINLGLGLGLGSAEGLSYLMCDDHFHRLDNTLLFYYTAGVDVCILRSALIAARISA